MQMNSCDRVGEKRRRRVRLSALLMSEHLCVCVGRLYVIGACAGTWQSPSRLQITQHHSSIFLSFLLNPFLFWSWAGIFSALQSMSLHLVVLGHRFCQQTQVNYSQDAGRCWFILRVFPGQRFSNRLKEFFFRLGQICTRLWRAHWVLLSWDLRSYFAAPVAARTRWLGSRQGVWLSRPCGSLDGEYELSVGLMLLSFRMWVVFIVKWSQTGLNDAVHENWNENPAGYQANVSNRRTRDNIR